ncbi:hypothetical protein Tco_1286875 [Tanacetum coccineum]
MFATEGRFEPSRSFGTSGSSVDRLLISVTDLGVKAFSHVNFDEYICVELLEGLLITGKGDMTCVETLYGWVVGFDEV